MTRARDYWLVMRYVASIALVLLLAGSVAHEHAESATGVETCSACVLAQSTVDPPAPAGELIAPPEERVLDPIAPVATHAPTPHVALLSVAPKTSPPRS